jgi:hypothetical protein
LVLVMGLSGSAQAALQGRDLNGSIGSFEAYYDTVLDITWLADANYAQTSGYDADGKMTWYAANTLVANLSFTDGINVYDNWRLPTTEPVNGTSFNYGHSWNGSTDRGNDISEQGTAFAGATGSEMTHFFYNTLDNKGMCDPVASTANSCVNQVGYGLANAGPFANLQSGNSYWSGSDYLPNPAKTWIFFFGNGGQEGGVDKGGSTGIYYALAVSSGDVGIAAVPEPEAWGLMLSGLALVGAAARRRNTR